MRAEVAMRWKNGVPREKKEDDVTFREDQSASGS